MFRNREDAGRQLAARLKSRPLRDPVVLAIPRGGVVVGAVLAEQIKADLDIELSRKLRAPDQPELAIGAVAENGQSYIDRDMVKRLEVSEAYLVDESRRQWAQIERRRDLFRQVRPKVNVANRSVIVTDDGIATGATMMAALKTVAGQRPHVPVASPDRLQAIAPLCDEIICLESPDEFWAIGQFYEDFEQTGDEEVVALLRRFSTADHAH
jgi:predicted phosphoribosyltransferase